MTELLTQVDHLVYGTPDLGASLDDLERHLGVRGSPGGQHLGEGTHNALMALGPSSYLEVVAPDPAQPAPNHARWLGVDGVRTPRLLAWVAKGRGLDHIVTAARRRGVPLGDVVSATRLRADGARLTWRVTDLHHLVADGIVPFLIDWGETVHPAAAAVGGLQLIALRAEHPEPLRVSKMLSDLGLSLPVEWGQSSQLIATIETPLGLVELR